MRLPLSTTRAEMDGAKANLAIDNKTAEQTPALIAEIIEVNVGTIARRIFGTDYDHHQLPNNDLPAVCGTAAPSEPD